ncbi:phosphotransferase family protein [Kibdelosporangium phytohabitans]|uniref:Aminoglycoside phosphotransferase n=1 Tax=Kibdelosporangium phytohabitans TaxID=860235 RepID=A0A0N9I286_9PSEU|nr:aminoglycoside phosphotransferase [Kibdelosporangium phytohabitans]ALG08546.1 aminoglycoside phosphotransferase [Kibdelosporangium phytohabitans]MBE1470378.1 spectinomycin phosphotransferase [Kibdelosporangium phytohabitans]
MLTPPDTVTDDAVLGAVRKYWLDDAETATHLPVGFGAHHWKVTGSRQLFVTLDGLAPRHTDESLEGAYAGAAALAKAGMSAVWPSLPATTGTFTVRLGEQALSAADWLDGVTPTEDQAAEPEHLREVIAALEVLHGSTPPPGIPVWKPRVGAGFPQLTAQAVSEPWTAGPLGEQARTAIAARLDDIAHWTARYLDLAGRAQRQRHTWAATHGEPHNDNQVRSAQRLYFVDWESLALAPRERDLVDLAGSVDADPAMIELFRLDWRLSEIAEYTTWFTRAHTGDVDDVTALDGLHEELRADD